MAGLQIPSMAYPPTSTVSHITRITLLSHLNDRLITDDIFRHSMYNFFYTEKQRRPTVCFEGFLAVNGDVGRPVNNGHGRSDDIQKNPWQTLYMSRSAYDLY